MNFGFPQFFWALLAVSIPLLIHLFNLRRPKTVYFSNTRFLKQLEEQSKSIKTLRHWLILSMRIGALVALILAFTLPFKEKPQALAQKQNRILHIYLDNSLSMKGEGNQGSLLNQGKLYLNELLKDLPDNMQVQLLSNDFLPRYQRYYSPIELKELLSEITYSPAHRKLKSVIQRFRNLRESSQEAQHQYLLISDFQKSNLGEDTIVCAEDELIQLVELRRRNRDANIAIDSIQFAVPVFVPGLDQNVDVFLRNYGRQNMSGLNLKFYLNDTLRSSQVIDLKAQSLNQVRFSFSPNRPGSYRARLQIDQGHSDFDDQFHFSFQTLKTQKVYLLSDNEDSELPLNIFSNRFFELRQDPPNRLDYNYLTESRLLLIQSDQAFSESLLQQVQNHLQKGKNLWIFPAKDALIYQQQLADLNIHLQGSTKWQEDSVMSQILNDEDPFLKKSILASKKKPLLAYSRKYLNGKDQGAIMLLGPGPNLPMISRKPTFKGQVFYCQTSLDPKHSNLGGHPLMIPLLANASFYAGEAPRSYLKAGLPNQYQSVEAPQMEKALELMTEKGPLIPYQEYRNDRYQISLAGESLAAGSYPLIRERDTLAWLAINTNPLESDLSETEQLSRFFKPSPEIIDPDRAADTESLKAGILNEADVLWPWFLALALLFIFLEMLFLKLKSRSS